MVDAARVNVKRQAQERLGHDRAFQMPAWRAATPGTVPFHLARFTLRRFAPNRKVGLVALPFYAFNPAFAVFSCRTRKAAIIRHC